MPEREPSYAPAACDTLSGRSFGGAPLQAACMPPGQSLPPDTFDDNSALAADSAASADSHQTVCGGLQASSSADELQVGLRNQTRPPSSHPLPKLPSEHGMRRSSRADCCTACIRAVSCVSSVAASPRNCRSIEPPVTVAVVPPGPMYICHAGVPGSLPGAARASTFLAALPPISLHNCS